MSIALIAVFSNSIWKKRRKKSLWKHPQGLSLWFKKKTNGSGSTVNLFHVIYCRRQFTSVGTLKHSLNNWKQTLSWQGNSTEGRKDASKDRKQNSTAWRRYLKDWTVFHCYLTWHLETAKNLHHLWGLN